MSAAEDAEEWVCALVAQACQGDDMTLDSMAISTYAGAMSWLAERGRIRITSRTGRRVIAEWVRP